MRESGFTLIETAIAMGLMALIVADVGMVAMHASRSGVQARRLSGAVSLAENAVEHVKGADFNRIRLVDSPLAVCLTGARAAIACGDPAARIVRECFSSSLAQVACDGPEAVFTRERDVATLPKPLPEPLSEPLPAGPPLADALGARIEILVSWTDERSGAQEFRLASIVSKY